MWVAVSSSRGSSGPRDPACTSYVSCTGSQCLHHQCLVTQPVKNLTAIWETWVPSPGWEDSLEKGKATCSSILAWRIPWTPWGHKELDTSEQLSHIQCQLESPIHIHTSLLFQKSFPFNHHRALSSLCYRVSSHQLSASQCRRHKGRRFSPWVREIP